MEISGFVSPLEAVHVLSIFNYLNTLSDFLYAENFLNKEDQHKRIPVVNAMYHYIFQDNSTNEFGLNHRKYHLTRKLINGTDLYGAKQHEIPDPYFTNTLFYHIVDNLVFSRFTNVYGFIVEIVRMRSGEVQLKSLEHYMRKTLVSLRYENEYGEDSRIENWVVNQIYVDLIEPLFPRAKNLDVQITSVDYIYAQAGKMFLKFDKMGEIEDPMFGSGNGTKGDEREYQEFVEVAHGVEQMVLAEKVDKSALKIFALPAMINYVCTEGEALEKFSIEGIMGSPFHWQKAYRKLFRFLNDAFLMMNNERDYRYQFSLALSNFKNRTTLAREQIEMNCGTLTDAEIEPEIIKYKNNPKSYKCKYITDGKQLDDLNQLFEDSVTDVSEKYHKYEKEYCRTAFGDAFINLMDTKRVEISKGLVQYYYSGGVGIVADSVQLVDEDHDLLQFYQPDSDTYTYYALVRKGFNISLIREADDPELFRKTLDLPLNQVFRSNNFPTILKKVDESFGTLWSRIANDRKKTFQKKLEAEGYDQTRKEWWVDFGLSLIPFYTCVQDIKTENIPEAQFVCPLDAVFLIPIAKEFGFLVAKIGQIASKSVLSATETTLRTIMLRSSIRTMLRVTGKSLIEEFDRFEELFTKETFKTLGIEVLRFIDPGFELAFTIGNSGLRSIKSLVLQAERKFATVSRTIKSRITKAQYTLTHYLEQTGTFEQTFGRNTYVTSIYNKEAGYGYKYIRLKKRSTKKILKGIEIRTIHPGKKQYPLVVQSDNTYKKLNLQDETIIGNEYFQEDEGIISDERSFELNVISNEVDPLVECGKLTNIVQTLRSKKQFQEAIDFALRKGRLSEREITNELRNYNFPQNAPMEMNFVREWMNNPELKTPIWAEKYKLQEPDLFFQLKYKETLDNPKLTIEEARTKINVLYPIAIHPEIAKELPVEKLLDDFHKKEAYNSARFEDYYALRWYGGSGYRKMGETTIETSRMKNAIYKLAIRQSEDPGEKYVTKLFRGERRLPEAIEKELSSANGDFEFNRFTSSSTEMNTALSYSMRGNPVNTRVTYVMNFNNPTVRARVEHLFVQDEKETILLPGTKFHIDKIERYVDEAESGAKQNCIRVEMTNVDEPKELRQKSIMEEIEKLKKGPVVFYPEDIGK
ncbi:uncharacterized protein LOC122512619 [Leptopilina heterotoma]|uniref:uncharacterized protein LOC122512619 n=1 Tax=Leptopilina heterotoma TaxID=63436 RepID=UPI001CA95FE0|nr:uncharacterized protein LOC122512619 [Leptopilina heterotoma]